MQFVALLRGINVGGNNSISMKELKIAFEKAGMTDVKTYINSGNVIFSTLHQSADVISIRLEQMIKKEFGIAIKVLVKSAKEMKEIVTALPDAWRNDESMKCDVLFLWPDVDNPQIVGSIPVSQDIDTLLYVNGALFWSVDRVNLGKSGITKLISTKLYSQMTVRNCNTARKLLALMQ